MMMKKRKKCSSSPERAWVLFADGSIFFFSFKEENHMCGWNYLLFFWIYSATNSVSSRSLLRMSWTKFGIVENKARPPKADLLLVTCTTFFFILVTAPTPFWLSQFIPVYVHREWQAFYLTALFFVYSTPTRNPDMQKSLDRPYNKCT